MENALSMSFESANRLATRGYVSKVPFTRQDLVNAAEIYGPSTAILKGRMTKREIGRAKQELALMDGMTDQTFYLDPMVIDSKHFLVAISHPLKLIIVNEIENHSSKTLGMALQDQISQMQIRGMRVRKALIDPGTGLKSLIGQFFGTVIEACGAGNHQGKVEIVIRRIKEHYRTLMAILPWKISKQLVPDAVKYVVIRMNMETGRDDEIPAKIKMNGIKPDFEKEYGISFGDCCEAYNPKIRSKDATQARSETLIALYPKGNETSSWLFYNIAAKQKVTLSSWIKINTTKLIIKSMNSLIQSESIIEEDENQNERQI